MLTLYFIVGLALDLKLALLHQFIISRPHHVQFPQTVAERKPGDCASDEDWDDDPKEDEGKGIFNLDVDLISEGNGDLKSFVDVCQFSGLQSFHVADLHYYAKVKDLKSLIEELLQLIFGDSMLIC